MLDFVKISTRSPKRGLVEVYPKFLVKRSKDLMIKGGNFYAVWDDETGLWSTDEYRAYELIDAEIEETYEQLKAKSEDHIVPLYMWDDDSGSVEDWKRYTKKHCSDSYYQLDASLTFSNDIVKKSDHVSKRLPYPLEQGDFSSYDEMMSVLYSPEERKKIEWAIGAIVAGEAKDIQKFEVFYGAAGTGKSTVLNIIQQLFEGYYSVFDARALGSSNSAFALEPFACNPLVAIQHDGDLSKIEDNTRLNSIVSHEEMTVNEKYMRTYSNRFNCFLFMGTNRPVKITDAKSGIIRRLIDVSPSGDKLPFKRYLELTSRIKFELGAIAYHCREVYLSDKHCYDDYIPTTMIGASNDFYNYVMDSYEIFEENNGTTLKAAWALYKEYCDDANVAYPYSMRAFKEELKNYFSEYYERGRDGDGNFIRNYYVGFKSDKFDYISYKVIDKPPSLKFDHTESLFDKEYAEAAAQYANEAGIPTRKWENVKTKLKDIDTSQVHYVKLPENHIVIDFDLKNKEGEKSYRKNLEAASKWPLTYAELSKSGSGIHLHYIYEGDVSKLSRLYDEDIEIKVFTGNSSLRRKLTKCNDIPIRTINSGLPLKGETKVLDFDAVKSEKGLRALIERNLKKEIHPNTKPSIDFIFKILEDAYNSGLRYDVSDMHPKVLKLATSSTHNSQYCVGLVTKMKFKSDEPSDGKAPYAKDLIIFFDVEVFPNLFVLVYKPEGKDCVKMINPAPSEVEELLKYKLIGFNCRRYDNHIMYARMMGYNNEQLYKLSQAIILGNKNSFFGEAYNLSYTDIYDFAAAGNKKSLKKLEIEMGIHHQELGLRWDEPVPEELWSKVADYCINDVVATEEAFKYLKADWTARQILADLAGMTVNDTTNSLTTRIIFGKDRTPQNEFNYRNLAEPVTDLEKPVIEFLKTACPEMMESKRFRKSMLPYFPGYSYDAGVSTYRGEEVGEGGYVYAEPGMYTNVALLDVSSMHPHSAIAECLFGVRYTKAFREIVEGRVSIKHEAWDEVNKMLNGKLTPYIQKVINGEMTSKDLANALKTAVNSVYGLTAARFSNVFKDPRNIDNIVAKRGALFMVDLKHEVQKRGFTVAHIKTDSIKIPNATPDIIEFVMNFGKEYGYTFEHEATYEKMCLVNDAVYIAKYRDGDWTATGAQFAVPYVFKTLFSHEPIVFKDMCETKTVNTALYLDMNEGLPEGEHKYVFVGKAGLFCPIKPGCGGGELLRESGENKYASATGAKGYRWLESENVQAMGKEDAIDISYYNRLVDDAVDEIRKHGDFEWFVSDDPVPKQRVIPNFMNIPDGYEETGIIFS